jgi:peptidoglycan/xylan/chitin deacetylase (PgdA/CDA1 family)
MGRIGGRRHAAVVVGLCALAAGCGGGQSTVTVTGTTTIPPPRTLTLPATTTAPAPPPPTTTAPAPPPPTTTAPPPPPTTTTATVRAGEIVTRLPTSRKVVALTFDAGAGDEGVPRILATLRETGTPATFFLTGRFAELFPSLARRIAGVYPVGNHTFDHSDLVKLSPQGVTDEIVGAQRAIARVTGLPPEPFFRFPYGSSDANTLRRVNDLGYTAVGWTVDTLGWEGTSGGQTERSVVERVLAGLQRGEIVLMHVGANPNDHSTLDADALRTVIDDVRARGYGFVTLADVLQ